MILGSSNIGMPAPHTTGIDLVDGCILTIGFIILAIVWFKL